MLDSKLQVIIKLIVFSSLSVLILIYVLHFYQVKFNVFDKSRKSICKSDRREIFTGIVRVSYHREACFYSRINDNRDYMWRCKNRVKDIIEIGDSIYKPSGTFDTYIYKNANPDSVIFIECDFDCDY